MDAECCGPQVETVTAPHPQGKRIGYLGSEVHAEGHCTILLDGNVSIVFDRRRALRYTGLRSLVQRGPAASGFVALAVVKDQHGLLVCSTLTTRHASPNLERRVICFGCRTIMSEEDEAHGLGCGRCAYAFCVECSTAQYEVMECPRCGVVICSACYYYYDETYWDEDKRHIYHEDDPAASDDPLCPICNTMLEFLHVG